MLAKITRSNQITIPREIILKAHLSPASDYVDVQYSDGVITIKPVDVEERVSPEQFKKFQEWALGRQEGDVDFSSLDKGLDYLRKKTKKQG